MKKKILFLDRDGVLNRDVSYLYKIEEFEWIDGAIAALIEAYHRNYEIIIVTNQSGIARGYYTVDDMNHLHAYMVEELRGYGVPILDIFYCPHHKDGIIPMYTKDCDCRKPKPGMLFQAMRKYDIDMASSFLIGDSTRDVEAAHNAGIDGYLFSGGRLDLFMKQVWEQRVNEGI